MPRRKGSTVLSPARGRKPATAGGSGGAARTARNTATAGGNRARATGKRLTQAERTALSEARMIDAAVQLIYERGTHNTTLKEIGERAGYSRALAGSRFGTKEALFFELLDQFNGRWKEESANAVGLRRGLDAFRSANAGLVAFFRAEARFIRVMYMIAYEMVGSSGLMREQLAGQHEAYRHGVARWLREGLADGEVRKGTSPERVAMQYVAGVFGTIYQWLVSPDAVDCARCLEDLRENTLQLVRT